MRKLRLLIPAFLAAVLVIAFGSASARAHAGHAHYANHAHAAASSLSAFEARSPEAPRSLARAERPIPFAGSAAVRIGKRAPSIASASSSGAPGEVGVCAGVCCGGGSLCCGSALVPNGLMASPPFTALAPDRLRGSEVVAGRDPEAIPEPPRSFA